MLTYELDPNAKTPLYEQLYMNIRGDIISGTINGGERLPSKRRLSAHLKVSQITVETAYSQLLAEGYITSEPRKGYYACSLLSSPNTPTHTPKPILKTLPVQKPPLFDFKTNIVDTGRFPFSTWAKLSRKVLSEYSERLLTATEPCGVEALREEIRRYLCDFRGFETSASNILIGAGSEYLINLMIQLLGREKIYAIENPGYRKLYQIFNMASVKLRTVPLDNMGLSADALKKCDADVVYITPSHHFPLGTVMPAGRRLELLRWASELPNRYIVEDDYDSEFRYSTRPVPTLSGLDQSGRVIYVNTFAKSLAPSLRIGYMVLPDKLMDKYNKMFSLYSSTVPCFEQYTLSEFMRTGAFERHISRCRKVYQSRRDALLNSIESEFSSIPHTVSGIEAGLHLLFKIQNGMNEKTLVKKALEYGVRVYGLSNYYSFPEKPPEATLVLGYAGLPEDSVSEAVKRLRQAWSTRKFN